ncbi:ATP-binding protein [Paludibaculum fermentans]|uniref:ATP-binding protein n=1 Tax=Paludibaculum fermentans TaxID=1473598 RepID=UPI003EBBB157
MRTSLRRFWLRIAVQGGYRGWLLLLLIAGIAGSGSAQPRETWRYFTSSDGLAESFAGAISAGVSGQIRITHGQIPQMSLLDGFTVSHIPSPGIDARVEEGGGQLWAVDLEPGRPARGLKRFTNGKWISFPVPDFGEPDPSSMIQANGARRFYPLSADRVLYLSARGLREYDAATGQSRPVPASGCSIGTVHSIVPAGAYGFWIAADQGIARISFGPDAGKSFRCERWARESHGDLRAFSNLFDGGEFVYASALEATGRAVLIRADEFRASVIARTGEGEQRIAGWPGIHGGTWVLRQGGGIHRLGYLWPDGVEEPVPESKVLSGRILDVAVQPHGIFWLAGVLGVARYAPPVWQAPGLYTLSKAHVNTIQETVTHETYFLGARKLWILAAGHWTGRELPVPQATNIGLGNRLAVLPGGRLAIPVRVVSGTDRLLVYNLRHDKFETPSVPGQSNCAFVGARGVDGAWVGCIGNDQRVDIYSYDGTAFRHAFRLPLEAKNEWPRAVVSFDDGSVWVGAFWEKSLFRYQNGEVTYIPLPPERSAMGVSDIAGLPDGKLLVGGRGFLLEYNGNTWREVARDLETVRNIYVARDASVWVAGGAGLLRCRDGGCVQVSAEDGLPDASAWAVSEDSHGRILVSTTLGARVRENQADPDPPAAEVPADLNVPRFAPGGEIQIILHARDRWKFSAPHRLLFSHRLDAGTWSAFHARPVLSLKGIAGGSHRLEVRALDRNFNVSPAVVHEFEVLVAWYRQPFPILALLLTCAIVTFSIHQHLSRHRDLARLVEEKTRQIAADYQERSRIQERFQTILDRAPVGIYVKDLQGRYLVSNLQHQILLGGRRAEVLGKTDAEIPGTETCGFLRANDEVVIEQDRVVQFEATDSREGAQRTYLIIKGPLYDGSGQPNAVCGISTDITESKAIQERLHRSQRLEAIGLLSGGIAHDFNNLLTVINGYAELMQQVPMTSPNWRSHAEAILQAGQRAAALTHQLLAFGRRQMMQPRVIDANEAISDLCALLRRLVRESVTIHFAPSPAPALLDVDPAQLEQVVMNLVINSRDALPGGGDIRIDIAECRVAQSHPAAMDGPCVRLRVADTGIGMDPQTLSRIFEPFYSTKEFGKGTGLGMATVYGIVRQIGGEIEVTSTLGKGTTVDVYLPVAKRAAEPVKPPLAVSVPRGNERILVVEDQPAVGKLILDVLTHNGYDVRLTSDPTSALALSESCDLLVTDAVMPVIHGTQLAQSIMAARPGIRVILMSGYADPRTDREHLDLPVTFLAKPFAPSVLIKAVHETLRNPPSPHRYSREADA